MPLHYKYFTSLLSEGAMARAWAPVSKKLRGMTAFIASGSEQIEM